MCSIIPCSILQSVIAHDRISLLAFHLRSYSRLFRAAHAALYKPFPLAVIGSKVNMAARLMMNYPSIVSCDEETYKAAISKLSKQDFEMLPFKPMKGIAEPGVIREYTKDHEYVIMPEVVYFLVGLASQNHTMFAPGFSIFKFAKIIYNLI